MAMSKQQLQLGGGGGGGGGGGRSAYSNWDAMLKRLNLDGTYRSPLSDGSYCPHPKVNWVISNAPEEIRNHDIDDRVFDISCHLRSLMRRECEMKIDLDEEVLDDAEAKEAADFFLKKMREIPPFNPKHIEYWLDELIEYAESNEVALILHSDGYLIDLLPMVLGSKHASLRQKAAEFVTAIVQNNPTGQHCVLDVNALDTLLYIVNVDPDTTSKIKALGAISALIRNNEPGINAFRRAKGYEALKGALSSESVGLQRDALNLIQYLLHEKVLDCNIVTKVTELGLHCIMMHLASSDDAEVREAALRGLLVLARDEEGGDGGQLVKNDDKMKHVLQELIEGISAMTPEDIGAAREEIQIVDSLWNVCYNEPSFLGEKGLLVLPGEDAPAPDVASKLFEPPVRTWAAAEAANRNSVIEKDYNIVTDLGLPRIMIHLASSDDAEVREAALKGLLVLTRDEEGGDSGQLVKNDDKLKQVLQERMEGISAMTLEDIGAAREEIQLVDSLWNVCYNEPSSLAEKGLLVLPGENVPALDVASMLFEPPPRAWAAAEAAEAADRNSLSEKEDPSAATPTCQSNSRSKRRKLN